jgi:hypothetical protein
MFCKAFNVSELSEVIVGCGTVGVAATPGTRLC